MFNFLWLLFDPSRHYRTPEAETVSVTLPLSFRQHAIGGASRANS